MSSKTTLSPLSEVNHNYSQELASQLAGLSLTSPSQDSTNVRHPRPVNLYNSTRNTDWQKENLPGSAAGSAQSPNKWRSPLSASHVQSQSSQVERSAHAAEESDNSKPTSPDARYKTELCRPFLEYGICNYGTRCQFAHGQSELRGLSRHPKYKTQLCRSFHTNGICRYGHRCHFVHNFSERKDDGGRPSLRHSVSCSGLPSIPVLAAQPPLSLSSLALYSPSRGSSLTSSFTFSPASPSHSAPTPYGHFVSAPTTPSSPPPNLTCFVSISTPPSTFVLSPMRYPNPWGPEGQTSMAGSGSSPAVMSPLGASNPWVAQEGTVMAEPVSTPSSDLLSPLRANPNPWAPQGETPEAEPLFTPFPAVLSPSGAHFNPWAPKGEIVADNRDSTDSGSNFSDSIEVKTRQTLSFLSD